MVRTHGFEKPFDAHQVASWFVFGYFAVFYAVFYAPIHTDAAGIVCTALYVLCVIGTVATNLMVVKTDPVDPGAKAKRAADAAGTVAPTPEDTSPYNFCYLCNAHVHKRSKHCRRCDKCVDVFDHHCPWLNTCVGAINYRYFLSLLVATLSLTLLQVVTALHAILRLATSRDAALADLHAVYDGFPAVAYLVLHIFTLVLVALAWLGLMQLFTFHIGLIYTGVTTYEFIVAQRNKIKARDAERGADYVPTCADKVEGWVQRNAPCLAVCDLCEAPPAKAPAPAKPQPSKKPGRAAKSSARLENMRQATATPKAATDQPADKAPKVRVGSDEAAEEFSDDGMDETSAATIPAYMEQVPSPLRPPTAMEEIHIDTRVPEPPPRPPKSPKSPRDAPPPSRAVPVVPPRGSPPPDAPGPRSNPNEQVLQSNRL